MVEVDRLSLQDVRPLRIRELQRADRVDEARLRVPDVRAVDAQEFECLLEPRAETLLGMCVRGRPRKLRGVGLLPLG